ncbi:hypothetical protein FDP41_005095 [Naegleria fowleri]|uniref:AAA+ ATPase domain-containing protein n=1 Tax=Naegleria fowleri TaxID=5763 RepID=A0A6A5BNN4_NAEFO|nr:uncharacterized protein FDP41_005095 [Naegleria fowleri]KAF0975768.1 hypothetical protein FDP41_005095 [Naegleria fowleri]CAG4711452.1 unnamed protein product [Naegleria fowleri]
MFGTDNTNVGEQQPFKINALIHVPPSCANTIKNHPLLRSYVLLQLMEQSESGQVVFTHFHHVIPTTISLQQNILQVELSFTSLLSFSSNSSSKSGEQPQDLTSSSFQYLFPYRIGMDSPIIFNFKVATQEMADNSRLANSQELAIMNSSKTTSTRRKYKCGGLKKEYDLLKKTLKQMIDLGENNVSAGVLVHGLSGTGKDLLVNTVFQDLFVEASSSKACSQGQDEYDGNASDTEENYQLNITSLHASMFTSKVYGQNEAKMRQFFQNPNQFGHTHSIYSYKFIILQDLDQLAPSNQLIQDSSIASKGGKRLVSTLLHALDDCPKKRIIVIGITNQFSKIDASIKRSGRLDQAVIECPIPGEAERADILRVIFEQCNIEIQEDLISKVASVTHGFVGSDLKSLCNEAILQHFMKGENILSNENNGGNDETTTSNTPPTLSLNYDLFENALVHVRPSAIRHILVEVPKVYWNDIGGQDNVKQALKESIEWPFKYAEHFKRMKIRAPRGVLLYGPPGCSKTLQAKALATEAKLNFLAVRGPELFSKWVGESERAVQQIFAKARQAAPSIIFFDEIDGLGVERGSGGNSVGDRVLSQLLQELDGIDPLQGVTVIAATNRPDLLDKALLRPGRIDRMLYVAPPDASARKEIMNIQLKRMSHNITPEQIEQIVNCTENYSGAEMTALCREAAYLALQENIHAEYVEFKHFEAARKTILPRITQEMLDFYKEFANKNRAD